VNHFRVALQQDRIAVEAAVLRLVACADPEALAG
jgi:hypothetical protein